VLLAGTAERVQRWRVLAEGLGLAPTCVEAEAGNGVDAAALADALAEGPDPRLVLLMQSEAEDGSTADLEGLSAVLEKSASLVVVDATLGFCADDLRMDDWGLDIVFSGTESGLAAGPGLSLVALGPRALAHFGTTATGRLGIALDLRRRVGESGLPADVLPSPAIGTLWLAVSMTLTSGHDRVLTRRRNLAERFRQGCSEGAGLGILATRPSAACTVLQLPTGATIAAVQSRLLASHGMIVASGMTATGPVLRVAHHGWRSEAEIDRAVAAIVDAVSAAPGQGGQASNMPQGGKGEMT
jgi:alanine-glyoxylate transaminase/serine-glyoxylate transaminase/serine-pyruvate transaminase